MGLLTYGLDRPLSGVTRVAHELGRALRVGGHCEVVYLTPYRRGPFRHEVDCTSWYLPGCARLPGLMALGGPLIALAARRLRLDVVHDPIGISPFTVGRWGGQFRRVVTIHDAIAFRYPEGYPWFNNLLHRRYVPSTLANVDGVVTDSHHAQADLQRFLRVPATQLRVVPLGVAEQFRPASSDQVNRVCDRYDLRSPFILSVGAQQARKNLERLVAAFALVRSQNPTCRLVIVGPRLWQHDGLNEQIAALGITKAVKVLGYVPDTDLPALYSAASLFAFPSLYEGFGLPVLESMACGTPVVCSNSTSLPEVAGDAALMVDPTSVQDLARAMSETLQDEGLRRRLRARGLERATKFTWERTALATTEVYGEVVAEGRV